MGTLRGASAPRFFIEIREISGVVKPWVDQSPPEAFRVISVPIVNQVGDVCTHPLRASDIMERESSGFVVHG